MRVNFSGKCERCDSFAKQTRRSKVFPAQEIIHKKMSKITPVIEGNTMIRPYDGSDHPESGHIEMIIGPMFSGKTTELIRRLKRYRVAQYACLIIKYAGDTRYNNDGVTTHDKQILPAISTKKLMPVLEEALQYDVIGIDEGQFFPDVSAFADHLANQGKIVMVAALDGTFQKKAFGDILNLVPKSENVTKLTAVCTICFKPAAFTRRKTQEDQVEVIGGEDKYLAVCRDCFTVPIPPSPERPVLREFNTPMTDDNKLERTKAHRRLFARFRTCLTGGKLLTRQPVPLQRVSSQGRPWRQDLTACYHGGTQTAHNNGDVYMVNLRSDTFTMPTTAMKDAMVTAPLGDDVYGEDPTVNKLQEECAALLGQEAALLVTTGTMGNICAILSHCTGRFEEVLLGDQSHIHFYEVGGIAALAGVQPRTVRNNADGTLDLDDLQRKIRDRDDPHMPWTRAVCLENTQNRCGGSVISVDYIKQVRELADANDLVMHLDGARVMNAATALQVPPSHITKHFDSISMCFSKGLSCPVGSILAGSKDFIRRALWARKALGGGMRQAGVIAAPMLVALKEIVPLLKDDHVRARKIAQAVADLGDDSVLTADMNSVQSNIIMLRTTRSYVTPPQVCQRLMQVTEAEASALGEKIKVQTVPFSETALRLVTYHGITDEDVGKSIKKLQYVLKEMTKV